MQTLVLCYLQRTRVPVESVTANIPWSPGVQNRSCSAWCRSNVQTSVILHSAFISQKLLVSSLFHFPWSLIDFLLWLHSREAVGKDLKGSGLTDFTRNSSQVLIPGLWGQRGSCDLSVRPPVECKAQECPQLTPAWSAALNKENIPSCFRTFQWWKTHLVKMFQCFITFNIKYFWTLLCLVSAASLGLFCCCCCCFVHLGSHVLPELCPRTEDLWSW